MGGWIDPFAGGSTPAASAPAAAPPTSGGGGWVDPFAGGGSGGSDNPVTSAQASIAKLLGIVGSSGDFGAQAAAQKAASGGGHHNWFSDVLSALDLPRGAVVSGAEQAGLALKSALGNGGPGGSFGGFLKGAEDHVTVGHVLHTDAGIKNKVVDSVGGIAGDVALDPLTYLGGMGEVGRTAAAVGHVADAVTSAEKASRLAAEAGDAQEALKAVTALGDGRLIAAHTADFATKKAAADEALAEAAAKTGQGTITGDTMARLKTRGLAGLNDTERAFLERSTAEGGLGQSLKTGVGIRVPGSKLAGNPKYLQVVPGAVTDPLTGGLKHVASRIGDSHFMQSLSEHLIPSGAIRNMVRTAALNGEGEKAAALQNILRLAPESAGFARATLNHFGPQFADALDQIPSDVHAHVPAAMEGDQAAIDAIHGAGGEEGLTNLRNTYDAMQSHAAEAGVPVSRLADYFPHQLTDAAREALQTSGGNVNRARHAFEGELGRTYKAGDTFLGHQLETGSIDEINRVAHDVYGQDAFDLFKTNPREITAQYVRGLSRRIGEQHLANELDRMGVTLSGDVARTPEEWQSIAHSLSTQLGKQAKKAGKGARQASDLSENLGVASGMAAETGPAKAPLTKWLSKHEAEFTKGNLKEMDVPLSSGNRFNLSDLVQHSDTLRKILEDSAAEQTARKGALSEARTALGNAGLGSGSDLGHLRETGANEGRLAPDYVKEALTRLNEVQTHPKTPNALLRFYDKSLNVWKQYALAMPGKAIRHAIASPAWGSYLGNVGTSSLREGFRAWRTFERGGLDAVKNPEVRAQIEDFIRQGVPHGHDFNTADITGPTTRTGRLNKAIHNPLSTRQGYFKWNQEVQRRGQDYWRFAMFHDGIKKGLQVPEAAAKTRTLLGDPHNITNFERSTARRLVPFYTFLRQNLPVELAAVAKQPGKFVNAYEAPKHEVEQWSNAPGIVPNFFHQTMGVRLPWQIGGNQVYLSPDLPFGRIGSLFAGKNQLAAQTSPLIQDLIAYVDNANTFTGNQYSPNAKVAPGAWADIPGLMPLLHAIAPGSVLRTSQASSDYGQTTPAGSWVMTPKAEAIVESLLPLLGQARRLDTTEPNMKTRGDTTILSDLVGQNFRTDDPSQQAADLYTRQAELKAIIENLQNQGKLPKYIYGFRP